MTGKQRRDRKIEFSANAFEAQEFKAAAETRGMSLSAWIRDACRSWALHERAKQRAQNYDAALQYANDEMKPTK